MKRIIILYLTLLLILFLSYTCNAQDTTYNTYSIKHDTLIRTTIPEKIILIGYRDSTIFDTSYLAYTVYQIYFTVDGSIVATIPIYDTIPAHDTVFICAQCTPAHDTTVISISPEPPDVEMNGLFPNIVPFTPLANRIHLVTVYSSNAFRSNTDVGSTWNTKQIHDSGYFDLKTYNDPPCCNLNYFVTGAALETAKTNLRNYLEANRNNLPEIISFNNEEANFNYWKGTAQDYVNALNEFTKIAHEYGVKVSNGGIIQPMIYYIRWVYQQEGNTAMVNEINARGHLFTGTGAAAQVMIDWGKVEIPALADPNGVDYVNIHHYEPSYNLPTNSDTTTGILPIIINFLHERTGKEIICTEFGSKYNSQNLFNQEADELDDNGVKIRVYYYGTNSGPVSDPHPDWWKAWILQ